MPRQLLAAVSQDAGCAFRAVWANVIFESYNSRSAILDGVRMIAQNAGAEGSIVLGGVRESKDKNFGYNAQTDEYENLVTSGVIDPTQVTRTVLQNAASIAGLLLTTECVVVERKEEKPAPAGGPPGGGMGGMY
jgi:chaperonin GroEL